MTTPPFTRGGCALLRKDIERALTSVAESFDCTIQLSPGSFTPEDFTCRLTLSVKGDGKCSSKEARDFLRCRYMHDLAPSDLGRTFQFKNQEWTIIGLSTRSRTYPILCETGGGKRCRFSARQVKILLPPTPPDSLPATPPAPAAPRQPSVELR